jgi:hypothetical protein
MMIAKPKYSYVYMSEVALRDNIGVRNILADRARYVGAVVQYAYFGIDFITTHCD